MVNAVLPDSLVTFPCHQKISPFRRVKARVEGGSQESRNACGMDCKIFEPFFKSNRVILLFHMGKKNKK